MIDTIFGTKFRGDQIFLLTVGDFYNEREYSGADWPVLLIRGVSNTWLYLVLNMWGDIYIYTYIQSD